MQKVMLKDQVSSAPNVLTTNEVFDNRSCLTVKQEEGIVYSLLCQVAMQLATNADPSSQRTRLF